MATITTGINEGRKAGVKGLLRHHPKTDMTPMVDLGFLLITFFVITTQLSQPRGTPLYMPKDGPDSKLGASNALTLLLGRDNSVYFYEGKWEDALLQNKIMPSDYGTVHGIREVIAQKQQLLDERSRTDSGRNQLMLLIKAGPEANYDNVLHAMDEAIIHRVKRYALVSPEKEETAWLADHH